MKSTLVDQKFGKLSVTRYAGTYKHGRHKGATGRLWKCQCKCGGVLFASTNALRNGNTNSCGCGHSFAVSAALVKRNFKHGMSHSFARRGPIYRTYMSWKAMRVRCTNPRQKLWHRYGGAGVKVCDRWDSFTAFLADMGKRPLHTTLGRFADTGNYEPENCMWMSRKRQTLEARKKRQTK
jgi:hypothetical protein